MKQEKNIINKIIPYIFFFILTFPSFFLNIKSQLDWGDDYAMYLNQADCLKNGISQYENGYEYLEETKGMGPKVYPVGFPIILRIANFFGAKSINHYSTVISICYFLAAVCFFLFIKTKLNIILSILCCILVFYNPFMLTWKGELLSEFPFFLMLLFSIFHIDAYFKNQRTIHFLLIVCGVTYTILTRSIGIVLVPSIIIYAILERKHLSKSIILSILILLCTYLSNVLFGMKSENGYLSQFSNFDFSFLIKRLELYLLYIGEIPLYTTHLPKYVYYSISIILLSLFLFKLIYHRTILEVLGLVYLVAIIIFPQCEARFLIPVFPILIYSFFFALKLSWINRQGNLAKITTVVLTLLLSWFIYFIPSSVSNIISKQNESIDGPHIQAFQDICKKVDDLTQPNEYVIFIKPRLLALYTDLRSSALPYDSDQMNLDFMNQQNIKYVIRFKENFPHQQRIEQLTSNDRCIRIYENSRFEIYERT